MLSQIEDQECVLARQFYEGSEWAFREMYIRYYQSVYKQAFKILRNSELAEDITQETFSKLWIHKDRITGIARNTLKPYLLVIARNLSVDENKLMKKRRQHYEFFIYESKQVECPTHLEKEELLKHLHRALGGIRSRRRRQVAESVYLKEQNRQEVMAEMGIARNTLKEHLRQAIKLLRDNKALWNDYL